MATKKIGAAGEGGSGTSEGHRRGEEATYKELWLAARAELDDLRTKFGTLLAKLDADAGVTDTNYGTTCALAAAEFEA